MQQRTSALDLDAFRANRFPDDYDTDLDSPWSNPGLFADGDDFSWQAIQKGRNQYYQKQLAAQVDAKTTATLALLTETLRIHLNVGQSMTMNTSSVFMTTQTLTIQSLSQRTIRQPDNAQIQLPANIQVSSTGGSSISLRVRSFFSFCLPHSLFSSSR